MKGLVWVVCFVNLHNIRLLVEFCQWLGAEFVFVASMGYK